MESPFKKGDKVEVVVKKAGKHFGLDLGARFKVEGTLPPLCNLKGPFAGWCVFLEGTNVAYPVTWFRKL